MARSLSSQGPQVVDHEAIEAVLHRAIRNGVRGPGCRVRQIRFSGKPVCSANARTSFMNPELRTGLWLSGSMGSPELFRIDQVFGSLTGGTQLGRIGISSR
jgi:hypothetical protein